jgi:hypothetical protein
MAQPTSVAQLLTAQSMISAGNITGFYQYMAQRGFQYAYLGIL